MKVKYSKVPEESQSDKIHVLKGENRHLKKIVKQLRKEIQRLQSRNDEIETLIEYVPIKEKEVVTKNKCIDCGKDARIVENLRGDGVNYYFCNHCGSKGPIK